MEEKTNIFTQKLLDKKIIIPTVVVIVVIVTLFLVFGKNIAKSKSAIIKDIQVQDSIISSHGLKVKESDIDKRQTNRSEKEDLVWLHLKAQNSDFEYMASYYLIYELYNNGWQLEKYTKVNSSYLALSEVDKSDIEQDLQENYDTFELQTENYNTKNKAHIVYLAEKEIAYVKTSYSITYDYTFSPYSMWEMDGEPVSKKLDEKITISEDEYKAYTDMQNIKSANTYILNGKYSSALSCLKEVNNKDNAVINLFDEAYEGLANEKYLEGEIDEAISYIEQITNKTDNIIEIQNQINQFKEQNKKWLGKWSLGRRNDKYHIWIKARYNNESHNLEMFVENGAKTMAGDIVTFDIVEKTENSITYHSDNYEVHASRTLTYINNDELNEHYYSKLSEYSNDYKLYRVE